jgi:hypothetical protein
MSNAPGAGGYSVHMVTGAVPHGKWLVGNPTFKADVFPAKEGSPGRIRRFVNDPGRQAGLRQPQAHAGGWRDRKSAQAKGKQTVYLDVSDAYADRQQAEYAMRLRNEREIYKVPDRRGRGYAEVENPGYVADPVVADWVQRHQGLFGA